MTTASSPVGALWSKRDAGLLGILLAVGALLLLIAWFAAAGKDDAGDQLVFVSLGILGAVVGWVGVGSWVLHGRRAISARRVALLGNAPPRPTEAAKSPTLVAGADGKWFHRSDCLLVDGRGWRASSRPAHEKAGRSACPGCQP